MSSVQDARLKSDLAALRGPHKGLSAKPPCMMYIDGNGELLIPGGRCTCMNWTGPVQPKPKSALAKQWLWGTVAFRLLGNYAIARKCVPITELRHDAPIEINSPVSPAQPRVGGDLMRKVFPLAFYIKLSPSVRPVSTPQKSTIGCLSVWPHKKQSGRYDTRAPWDREPPVNPAPSAQSNNVTAAFIINQLSGADSDDASSRPFKYLLPLPTPRPSTALTCNMAVDPSQLAALKSLTTAIPELTQVPQCAVSGPPCRPSLLLI